LERSTTRDGTSPVIVKTVQPATVPTEPTGRGLTQWLVLGMLVGIAAGVVLVLVRNAMDNTVKTLGQLREVSGVPNLGVISYDSQLPKRPLIVHYDPLSARAEAFRQLRTNVQFVEVGRQHKVLTVTSAVSGEGKTTTVVNLAIALGSAGGSVLLIEADLRRPKAAEMLRLERSVGLTNVIAGWLPVQQTIQSWESGPIDVLASGPVPPNPTN
jgi:non-specific protein-tyrosine kinase